MLNHENIWNNAYCKLAKINQLIKILKTIRKMVQYHVWKQIQFIMFKNTYMAYSMTFNFLCIYLENRKTKPKIAKTFLYFFFVQTKSIP